MNKLKKLLKEFDTNIDVDCFNTKDEIIDFLKNSKTSKRDSSKQFCTGEFIDIDIDKAREDGFKYIITAEFIYSGADNYDSMQAWSGIQLLSELRTEKKKSININDSLFKVKLAGKYQSHVALAFDMETNEIVIIDQYSEESNGINIGHMAKKMNEYKRLYFNANEFSENIFNLISMYCEANEMMITEDIESADIICSYDDYKEIKEGQSVFNVSNNLEKIIGLLN